MKIKLAAIKTFLDKQRSILYNEITMKTFNSSNSLKKQSRTRALIEHYQYGKMPNPPKHLRVASSESDRFFAAGKAELISVSLSLEFDDGECYNLPIRYALPRKNDKHPAFIHIKDNLNMPDRFQPTEELCDLGFAVVSIGVDDLLSEFSRKRRGIFRALRGNVHRGDASGSIAIFAWCAMRAVDYLTGLEQIDWSRITVIGHGIYGTAALLAAAYDDRISAAISNSAGPTGVSERASVMSELFALKQERGDLFCRRFYNLYKMSGKEDKIPFEGAALISLIAPRRLLLDNASDEMSRYAESELRVAANASEYYEDLGVHGLSSPKGMDPCVALSNGEACFMDGRLAYRCRRGLPYLSREDWQAYARWLSEE